MADTLTLNHVMDATFFHVFFLIGTLNRIMKPNYHCLPFLHVVVPYKLALHLWYGNFLGHPYQFPSGKHAMWKLNLAFVHMDIIFFFNLY